MPRQRPADASVAPTTRPSGDVAVATMTFQSSRTFLEVLFPTADFCFARADTLCRASIVSVQMRLKDGTSPTEIALRLHEVQHVDQDGTRLYGVYVPLMMVNDDGAFGAHRGETPIPTISCDIKTAQDHPKSWRVTASIGSEHVVELALCGLNPAEPRSLSGPDATTSTTHMSFCHTYTSGKQTGEDSEDHVFPIEAPALLESVSSTRQSRTAHIRFSGLQLKDPGLSATMKALAAIPVYVVEDAQVIVGRGQAGFQIMPS